MRRTLLQLARYGVIGVLSNAAGFLIYYGLTVLDIEHKLAMTSVYAFGVMITFVFNKRWTFQHRGAHAHLILRYVIVYAVGYVVNLGALYLFVDRLGHPHTLVQGCMILLIAMMIFAAQKLWIFRAEPADIANLATHQ